MQLFLMISLLIVALLLVGIILIQQGKGAEIGASFGAGASNTLFGAPGAGNFLTKSTTILAIIFFALALTIHAIGQNEATESGLLDDPEATQVEEVTAQPAEIPAEAQDEIPSEIPAETQEEISTEIPTSDAETISEAIPEATEEETKEDDQDQ
ncbi:preprotein translocase subunit SecG [Kangiella aquimarina]|uniref:Protein-export membrane protein SecG n=1 Tax=Kangiella aquimarina TaxID=261965 RepID=A0ABZ0X6B9_9GAMM|nr:preprotein translocase subunit SecG [Kangiella aquimarina]WQG85899.1 preprotein translocase subunit SecG [Kangiella aquimarina]